MISMELAFLDACNKMDTSTWIHSALLSNLDALETISRYLLNERWLFSYEGWVIETGLSSVVLYDHMILVLAGMTTCLDSSRAEFISKPGEVISYTYISRLESSISISVEHQLLFLTERSKLDCN
jgi:hypothetical protein